MLLRFWALIVTGGIAPGFAAPVTPENPEIDSRQPTEERPIVLPDMGDLRLNRTLEGKYFHEPIGHELGADDMLGHYDTRFFYGMVTDEERVTTLEHMVRAYLSFFRKNNLETWIAHGTLLGWWWNGKVGENSLIELISHISTVTADFWVLRQ